MRDNGEQDACITAIREFLEEVLSMPDDDDHEEASEPKKEKTKEELAVIEKLKPLWENGTLIYQGYVKDHRKYRQRLDGDNCLQFHDKDGLLDNIKFKAGSDAKTVGWVTVEEGMPVELLDDNGLPKVEKNINIFPAHIKLIKLFAEKHGIKTDFLENVD
uniref:Uncharacterized protein n=1 Tax=Ditylenchus dipsaci TaxID=166011 RepID=A0A915D518_9BILA